MPTESQYWANLKKAIGGRVYTWKINASYAKGIPDCWFSGSEQDLWVENKRVASETPPPVLDLTDHKKYLTIHQQLWLEQRYEEGRNVGVIVFCKAGHLWLPGLAWKEKITRLQYLDSARTMSELASEMVEICGPLELK